VDTAWETLDVGLDYDTAGAARFICSTHDGDAAVLSVVNSVAVAVDLYWVDQSCAEHYYAAIESGMIVTQPTFQGHAWAARQTDAGVRMAEVLVDAAFVTLEVE